MDSGFRRNDEREKTLAGNYNEYEADKKRRLGDEGAQPHRVKYKKLA